MLCRIRAISGRERAKLTPCYFVTAAREADRLNVMPNKADLLTELNWLTEKISSLVWTLNVGTLGTTPPSPLNLS